MTAFPSEGACVGQDSGFWDTDYPDQWPRGRRICLTACTQRDACLAWVMTIETGTGNSRSGIYAGLTPDQRADLAGNYNRTHRVTYDRCTTCQARMAYAEERPLKVRKQASGETCLGCWQRERQVGRDVRPSERRAS